MEAVTTDSESPKAMIAKVASKLLLGDVDTLVGLREIVALRGSLFRPDSMDPELMFLVGVESELDDVPSGSTRSLWAPDALAQKEQAMAEYFAKVHDELVRACESLRTRWLRG